MFQVEGEAETDIHAPIRGTVVVPAAGRMAPANRTERRRKFVLVLFVIDPGEHLAPVGKRVVLVGHIHEQVEFLVSGDAHRKAVGFEFIHDVIPLSQNNQYPTELPCQIYRRSPVYRRVRLR